MVFLVKSNNGVRTTTILKNSEDKNMDLTPFIEALKGLKIKIEVKVEDVVLEGETVVEKLSKLQINSKPVTAQPKAAQPKPPQLSPPKRQEPISQPSPPAPAQPKASRPSQPVSSTPVDTSEAPQMVKAKVMDLWEAKSSKATENHSPSPISIDSNELLEEHVRRKIGKPKIQKGRLRIGQEIDTYAIALDDNTGTVYMPYDRTALNKIVELIAGLSDKIESQPLLKNPCVDDIVFAKSCDDDQWYRAIIEEVVGQDMYKVNYFDWGLFEKLDKSRLRHLMAIGLSDHPACALKVEPKPGEFVEEFKQMARTYRVRIDTFNDFTETYTITIIERSP